MPRVVLISDTHNLHKNLSVPDGDILIHAGDVSNYGKIDEIAAFADWFKKLPHKHKICIAGNHDWAFQDNPYVARLLTTDFTYLENNQVEVEDLKIYGFPQTPNFCDWAFMPPRDSDEMRRLVNNIPDHINILVCHGPPYKILDESYVTDGPVGCKILRDKVLLMPNLKICVFGHIHGAAGAITIGNTQFINASVVNEGYKLVNKPVIIDL